MYPLSNISLSKAKGITFYAFVFFACIQINVIQAFSFHQSVDSTQVIFLPPSDDCFVRGGVYADMNFDSLTTLIVKGSFSEQYNRQTYLKFDVSALQGYDIDTAILRLTFNSGTDSTVHALRLVNDDSWREDSLTWNNKPSINSLIDTVLVQPNLGSQLEFELTEAMRSEANGDGILSLNISEASSVENYIAYFSSGHNFTAYHPHIEVIYRNACADEFEEFALTEFPQNLQLYARDTATNRAVVEVIGEVETCGDSVSLVIWRDSLPFAQYGAKPDTSAAFAFYPEITAELAQYTFELYEITATDTTLRASAADVVAGDVYIINGQSNAEAQQFEGSSAPDASPFIRVHGYGSNPNDTLWHIGQGDGDRTSQGNTGQWGLYFAKQIVDNQGIPIAVFNGARGGWRMRVFRRHDPDPETPHNNYGQLLARLNRTKLADKVRAILWYQGEEDVIVTTPTDYKQYFNQVYDAWMEDYSSAEQVYLTEIRTGCFSQPHEAVLIQDALRQLVEELPKTSMLSTKGLLQHGDCHFEYEGGYKELGRRFYRLIERDLYAATTAVVESPNISTAAFTAPDEITLTMQAADSLIWESGSQNDFILEGDSLTTVISGYTDSNTIVLQLSADSTTTTGITYLDKSGTEITSPFIINSEGHGMISFFNFPIDPQICAKIDLKVYLQGAYKPNTDSMNNGLYQRGLLPGQVPLNGNAPPTSAGQPYHISPWNYSGTEGENWSNNDYLDNTIDWLLVSFRTNINSGSEIARTAALLLNNGQIEFPDRCALPLPETDSLYILVQHRNHMGVMSPAPVHFVNASLTYDFTTNNSYRDNTGYGQINIGSKWAMYAADANQNEIPSYDINGADKSLWNDDNGSFDRYRPSDFDLNGDINGADKFLWNQNNGISSRVPK